MTSDTNYYSARALEELERAAAASNPGAAAIHRELAAKYAALADEAAVQPLIHLGRDGASQALHA